MHRTRVRWLALSFAGAVACSSGRADTTPRRASPGARSDGAPTAPWTLSLGPEVNAFVRSAPHGEPFVLGMLGRAGADPSGRVPIVAAYDVHGGLRWIVEATSQGRAPRPIDAVPLVDGGLAMIGALDPGRTTIGDRALDAAEGGRFLAVLASDGSVRFARTIMRSEKGSLSTVAALAAAPDGGWLLGGQLSGAADFGDGIWSSPPEHTEAVLLRYDASGTLTWSHRWRDTGMQSRADIDGVVIDPLGHVVITGIASATIDLGAGPVGDPAVERNAFLAGFRADGVLLWSRFFGTPSSTSSLALTAPVALDDGRIVVGGTFDGGIDWGAGRRERGHGALGGFVAAYDIGGHLVAGGETAFVPVSLVDDGGAISVAGFDPSDGRTLRAAVAHVTLDGTVLDLLRIGEGSVRSIAPGPGNDVYVCGGFHGVLSIPGAAELQTTAAQEGFVARMFP